MEVFCSCMEYMHVNEREAGGTGRLQGAELTKRRCIREDMEVVGERTKRAEDKVRGI